MRPFHFKDRSPSADDYAPPSEQQIEWTAEDGAPMGDEPLELPEGENPYLKFAYPEHHPYYPDGGPGLTEEEPS